MDILNNLATGFAVALTPINLLYCFLGSFIGTAIGVLPGLGPPATIALLLPVTYGIPATSAVILLAGIFYGAMYGGSTTSILLNIPGEAASVVTCLDGYQMARQGRAGAALAVAAVGSFIAGTIGVRGLRLLATREEWKAAAAPMARGSLLGFIIGVLPGGGAIISSFLSYALEKRFSRHPERFGKGAIEGVAAPEAANNGAASSSFIPLLTLGIPGNASIALIFAALLIHGIRPGPLLVAQQPQLFWGLIASMYIGNVMLLVLNLPLIRVWVRLLQVPYGLLAPFIIVFVLVGAYSVNNSAFDVGVAVAFGLVRYVLRKLHFEPAPLVLAMILGPQLEASVRRALIFSRGDVFIFFERPIAAVLMALAVLMLLSPLARWALSRKFWEIVGPVRTEK